MVNRSKAAAWVAACLSLGISAVPGFADQKNHGASSAFTQAQTQKSGTQPRIQQPAQPSQNNQNKATLPPGTGIIKPNVQPAPKIQIPAQPSVKTNPLQIDLNKVTPHSPNGIPAAGKNQIPGSGAVPGKVNVPGTVNTIPGLQNIPGLNNNSGNQNATKHSGNNQLPVNKQFDPKTSVASIPLTDRVKSGQLDHVTNAGLAKKFDLKQQFVMRDQGDLSRRLNLNTKLVNAGGWQQNRIWGPISPNYTKSSFSYAYAGPGWYPTYCWFPTWSPWLTWCWNYTPVYDPRPIYCQPVVYAPCQCTWQPWTYPTWQPLPVVACGTWVDVPVAPVANGYDVQLLAVRFVDPGHPEQKEGPRYRVVFRNNSTEKVSSPFNVVAYASNEQEPVAGLPEAGVRVPAIDAGAMQAVDLRLPIAANELSSDAEGRKLPFKYLHVILDSGRELTETIEDNNGAVIARSEVLPADPSIFGMDRDQIDSGTTLNIAGEGFGPEPGRVLVNVKGLELQAEVIGWYDLGVRVKMPAMPLASDVQSEVIVIRGDQAASNPMPLVLLTQNTASVSQ